MVGGDGDDRLFGGADGEYQPDECYYGDLLVPGAGDDHVDLGTGEQDIWFWESDLEVDQVSYADSPVGVQVDLTAGTAVGHGTETIVTGDGADVVAPDSPGRTSSGWRLDDDRREPGSQPGDDTVSTGSGSDGVVWVQRGADVVRGGADVDRLTSYSPDPGTRLLGGEGEDRLIGEGHSTLLGQSGNDALEGVVVTGSPATWDGGAGRDSLTLTIPGRAGLDQLRIDVPARRVLGDGVRLASLIGIERFTTYGRIGLAEFVGGRADEQFRSSARRVRARGGAGSDTLAGSGSADLLDGGPGRDLLDGNAGRDRCLRGERLTRCEVRR